MLVGIRLVSGPFSSLKVGDKVCLPRSLGCWAPAGEVVTIAEVSGNGNGVVLLNISGERYPLTGETGARLLGIGE